MGRRAVSCLMAGRGGEKFVGMQSCRLRWEKLHGLITSLPEGSKSKKANRSSAVSTSMLIEHRSATVSCVPSSAVSQPEDDG
jgi:hypothetical protein